VTEEYWTVAAHVQAASPAFANLVKKDGKNVEIGNAAEAQQVRSDPEQADFIVARCAQERRGIGAALITSSCSRRRSRSCASPCARPRRSRSGSMKA
jgi:hypothetical protein